MSNLSRNLNSQRQMFLIGFLEALGVLLIHHNRQVVYYTIGITISGTAFCHAAHGQSSTKGARLAAPTSQTSTPSEHGGRRVTRRDRAGERAAAGG